MRAILAQKRRHERSSCSCREASDATYFQLRRDRYAASITGIYTRYHRLGRKQIQKSKLFLQAEKVIRINPRASNQLAFEGPIMQSALRKEKEARISDDMASSLESEKSPASNAADGPAPGWLKLGVVAAASVFAGGLAAAWWYRKTLTRLRQAEEKSINTHFGMSEDDSAE